MWAFWFEENVENEKSGIFIFVMLNHLTYCIDFSLFKSINTNQTANITHKFMTFYLILKNRTYVKRPVGTQNKQKWIVHLKNIIINKCTTYFYAEKFCFYQLPICLP